MLHARCLITLKNIDLNFVCCLVNSIHCLINLMHAEIFELLSLYDRICSIWPILLVVVCQY